MEFLAFDIEAEKEPPDAMAVVSHIEGIAWFLNGDPHHWYGKWCIVYLSSSQI